MSLENFQAAKIAIQAITNAGFPLATIAAFADLPPHVVSFVHHCRDYGMNQGVDAVVPDILAACRTIASLQFSLSISRKAAYEAAAYLITSAKHNPTRKTEFQPAVDFLLSSIKQQ
jgi:hypothetical protein